MDNRTAIITGVNGQTGSFLAELLLEKNFRVIGIVRRSSTNTHERIDHLKSNPNFVVVEGDITDAHCVNSIVGKYKPYSIFNMAAMSHVGTSFEQPTLTWKVDAEGVINILEAIKHYSPTTRLVQASTSEMFGSNYSMLTGVDQYDVIVHCDYKKIKPKDIISGEGSPYQDEETPFAPQSPYAIAKVAAHHAIQLYRQYGLHTSAAISFNHESPRRGEQFVTRKITKWIGEFKKWTNQEFLTIGRIDPYLNEELQQSIYYGIPTNGPSEYPKLRLGNLDAYRDWGHAQDTARAIYLMSEQDKPDDYVISTGETHTVRDFLKEAFEVAELGDWQNYVIHDSSLVRPAEVDYLCGRSDKAKEKLGWKPEISFKQLVKEMVEYDILQAKKS